MIEDIDTHVQWNTSFLSSWNPDTIEEMLKTHLASIMKINPITSQKKYKTKFTIDTKEMLWSADEHQEKDTFLIEQNEVCVRILKVDEETVCVEFTNLRGPQLAFLNIFNQIK